MSISVEEVIVRATDSINEILKWPRERRIYGGERLLIDICNRLNQLLESNYVRHDWTRLFCRQLNRFMDSNDSLSESFWNGLGDDIQCVLDGPNGRQNKDIYWEEFLKKMQLESELVQRELQFQKTFHKRKSLYELFNQHTEFFKEYLQKCISFHSKVQVQGLVENINDLLYKVYGLKQYLLTSESQKRLKEKLNNIEITFDFSNRSLQRLGNRYDRLLKRIDNGVNDDLRNFLPSVEQIEMNKGLFDPSISDNHKEIVKVLQCDRWIVILGDPGSAKTTLLRWITRVFAETVLRNDKEVVFELNSCLPVRIPILIRIGEFASWIEEHQTLTLMDYIGKHTWFSEPYCHDDSGAILKELIYHGHALILLDGLDEIPEVRRRGEIVDLVRKFIDEYVRAPDFISAFDRTMFDPEMSWNKKKFAKMQPPSKPGGNQIIVTSRVVGYQFYQLNNLSIQEYSLLLMNHKEAKKFVQKWMTLVEKDVLDVLLNEEIKPVKKLMRSLSKKRYDAVQLIFQEKSGLLMSNPSLLSLTCTFIFQSFDEFHPKSRVEVYHHAVQLALRSWTTQESSISKDLINNFLINLSTYLHLESPSGLIDAFDMEHLCCLILQQQGVSNSRAEVREHTKKLICILESNKSIVSERGLQIFGFLHLSFQEYFVSQSFVKGFSIKRVAKRILTFSIHSRFRESIRMTLGWISWKWSFDDYDKLCNLLVIPNKNYAIPIGTLIFFDAFNDMQRLASNSIILTALNNLLHHPCRIFGPKYLLNILSQIPENIITEWMQSNFQDEKYIFKFCEYFLEKKSGFSQFVWKFSPVVYQQLSLCHNISTSAEFVIDQTLRRIILLDDTPKQIFNKELSLCLSSNDIHPLILSVMIALCGGVCSDLDGRFDPHKRIPKIYLSPSYMHRECSILSPIVKYFKNNKESHSIKIQTLINHYENVLQKSLPSDISVDIVDTFIALICLQSVSHPSIYKKYEEYQALPLAIDRFKSVWFYFKESCEHKWFLTIDSYIDFIELEFGPILNVVFSQFDRHRLFLLACAAACKKLRMLHPTRSVNFDNSLNNNIDEYFQYQTEFIQFINENDLDQIAEDIHTLKILQKEPFFLLRFLPESLQKLYYYTIISPTNETDSLPFVIFLSQCLIHLEDIDTNNLNSCLALPMLQPLLRGHLLENYGLVLFREKYPSTKPVNKSYNEFYEAMENSKLLDQFLIDQSKDWESLINMERLRICELKNAIQNQEKHVRLFAASISLARLFQGRYRSHKNRTTEHINLSIIESEEVHFALIDILDPILRIISWSIILDMKDPLIFDEEQKDEFRSEMIGLLQSLLPSLSLLTSTLLFVRCYTARQVFPVLFRHMADIIGKKLTENLMDKRSQDQEVAYIVLRQLDDLVLEHYLSEFAKQTMNLADLLHFNSTIFHQCFTNITSFHSLNTTLLSIMYLTELAFDTHILNIYANSEQKNEVFSLRKLKHMWNKSSNDEKIMTYETATWITKYLQILSKEELNQIIDDLSKCSIIEKKAFSVIEKWINYRMNENLKFFAQFAALQLIIRGSNIPDLIDIINEMFDIDNKFRLKSLIPSLFTSSLVDLSTVRLIFIALHRNIRYNSIISVWIDRKEIFEIILTLEFERITSNMYQLEDTPTNPFLLMIKGCSEDLQVYLTEHLRTCIDTEIKEEYIALVIKWVIESSVWSRTEDKYAIKLYKYIFTLLHDKQFPRIQKIILNALNSVFLIGDRKKENVFMQDDSIGNLEKIIYSWETFSKDILEMCLLAYGNCLLELKTPEIVGNITEEMKNIFLILFETLSSQITSLRAAFCLMFVKGSYVNFDATLDWFKNKWNITIEKGYKILLQQTLYEWKGRRIVASMETFAQYLEKHSAELMDRFVIDLYSYLSKNNNRNYLSDHLPDLVIIIRRLEVKTLEKLCDAVRKSSFGEKEFKTKLSFHYKMNPRDNLDLMYLYIHFGILTDELVHMLKCSGDNELLQLPYIWRNLKKISDQGVIENLFQLLKLKMSDIKFRTCLDILKSLTDNHMVSLLEVHQRISVINNILLYDHNDESCDRNQNIFDLSLDISCFAHKDILSSFKKSSITKNYIDEDFHREIVDLDKKFPFFIQG